MWQAGTRDAGRWSSEGKNGICYNIGSCHIYGKGTKQQQQKNQWLGVMRLGPERQRPAEILLCDPVPPGKRVRPQSAIATQSPWLVNRGPGHPNKGHFRESHWNNKFPCVQMTSASGSPKERHGQEGASPKDLFHFQQEPQSRQPFFKAIKRRASK